MTLYRAPVLVDQSGGDLDVEARVMGRNSLGSLVSVLSNDHLISHIGSSLMTSTYVVSSTENGRVDLGKRDIFADGTQQLGLFSPFSIERDIKLALAESTSVAEGIRLVRDSIQANRIAPPTTRFAHVVSGKEAL